MARGQRKPVTASHKEATVTAQGENLFRHDLLLVRQNLLLVGLHLFLIGDDLVEPFLVRFDRLLIGQQRLLVRLYLFLIGDDPLLIGNDFVFAHPDLFLLLIVIEPAHARRLQTRASTRGEWYGPVTRLVKPEGSRARAAP